MIYFLIPAYNESENIPVLLRKLKSALKAKSQIFIVDDGSTDKTKHVIKELSAKYPVTRIGYDKNRGPGYAFKFGFNYLIPKLKNSDLAITMEADNTSDLTIITKMINQAKKSDVVLASPYARGGKFLGISALRKTLSFFSNILDKLIFRVKNVRTYSSFFRLYRGSILKKAKEKYANDFITEDGFSAVAEFLVKLSKIGATFSEVPAIVDWRNREGKSKMKITKTIVRHLGLYKNYLQGKYTP